MARWRTIACNEQSLLARHSINKQAKQPKKQTNQCGVFVCLFVCLFGWLVGWLVGWLTGRLLVVVVVVLVVAVPACSRLLLLLLLLAFASQPGLLGSWRRRPWLHHLTSHDSLTSHSSALQASGKAIRTSRGMCGFTHAAAGFCFSARSPRILAPTPTPVLTSPDFT